jgi:serine/threonine protein kinase
MKGDKQGWKDLDTRTDLFSFGVVLCEMTTGRLPFDGDATAVIFDGILNRAPTSVLEINPALPTKLAEFVKTAPKKIRRRAVRERTR